MLLGLVSSSSTICYYVRIYIISDLINRISTNHFFFIIVVDRGYRFRTYISPRREISAAFCIHECVLKVSRSEQVIQVVLMPSIKIYPPAQLPDRNISETQFNIWKEEIEVYISQEKDFKIFLPGQAYANWESAEAYGNRIRQLNNNDVVIADRDTTAA